MTQAPTPGPLSGDDWRRTAIPLGQWVQVDMNDQAQICTVTGIPTRWRFIDAPTAPVEASGSEREAMEAALAELKRIPAPLTDDGDVTSWDSRNEVAAGIHAAETWLERALNLRTQPSGETRSDFTSVTGLWKDQGLSRLERVKAHRSEFGSELKQAVEAVDEETARQTIASKSTPARAEAPSEDDARRRLINLIEQWDGETEYDAEDIASLADDILHAFNGSPVLSSPALGYVSADAETALKAGVNRVIYPAPSAHASFPLYAAPVPAQDDDKLRTSIGHMSWMRKFVPCVFDVTEDRLKEIDDFISQEGGE